MEPQSPNLTLVEPSDLGFAKFGGLGYRQLPYNHHNLTWVFAVSVCDNYPYFSTEAVVAASDKYRILTPGLECAGIYRQVKGTKTGAISEWGQEFSAMDYVHEPTALYAHTLGRFEFMDRDFGGSVVLVSFQYHMWGGTKGTALLQGSGDGRSTYTTLWSNSGDGGGLWFQQRSVMTIQLTCL